MKRKFNILLLAGVLTLSYSGVVYAQAKDSTEATTVQPAVNNVAAKETAPGQSIRQIQDSLYRKGISDATIHHKRFGRNFLAGFFGVQWGFLTVALVNPKLPDPQVVGQDNFNNPDYQKGYRKKAKEKNVLNALAGFVIPLSILLVISSAESSK